MHAIAVIPARLGSTRLPRKVLAEIGGHPLIWHVWSRVMQAKLLDSVWIATDSLEVQGVAESWGAKVLMTNPECRSGTERIASIVGSFDTDLVVNVQGDEPFVDPGMVDAMVEQWRAKPCDLITAVFRITELEDVRNWNIVKVARASDGRALYFSRSPIPFVRDLPTDQWLAAYPFWGHIGIYGYRRNILVTYPELPISMLETAEQLEQLRFLDAGYIFQTIETSYRPMAVDVADDLERVRLLMGGV